MKAFEAKAIALKNTDRALEKIIAQIKMCAEEGLTRTDVWNKPSEMVLTELEKLHYTVKRVKTDFEDRYYISWE